MVGTSWYERNEVDGGVIISSRVRLARNLRNHPFPARINSSGAAKLLDEVKSSLERAGDGFFGYEELTDKPAPYLRRLLERHVISLEMATKNGARGFLISGDESVCVMINEEDHVRVQTFCAGENLRKAFSDADKIDDLIEESVEYAFDPQFGYLTSCPTNTGTGMRAGFMLHLPALEKTARLKGIIDAAGKLGIAFRGIHGEGSEPAGSVYQISNQTTLGKPELETIKALENVTRQVIDQECQTRGRILRDARTATEDKVWRAYGILTNCRAIKTDEALSLLSDVRTGFLWGLLGVPKPKTTIYNMMMEVQQGGITVRAGREVSEPERDVIRAEYVRDAILGVAE